MFGVSSIVQTLLEVEAEVSGFVVWVMGTSIAECVLL